MKIIVIVDMQNKFITGSIEAVVTVPNVIERLKQLNNSENLILFTKFSGTENSICKPISEYVDRQSNFCSYSAKDIIKGRIYKETFGSIRLAEIIKKISLERPIEEVVLMGLHTETSIISNALLIKTYCPEVEVTVENGCCASRSPENQAAALKIMKACKINIV